MPGVLARGRAEAQLTVTGSHASPLGAADGPAAAGAGPARPRPVHDEDAFEVAWSEEFRTPEEAQAITRSKKLAVLASGFYSNATGKKTPMTREQFIAVRGGKKTAHVPTKLASIKSGDSVHKTFAFYENPMDASTVRFVVRTLTRK
jgi:hypothetical protein